MFVVGQNLNSASPSVHAALAAGDRTWVERCVRAQVVAGADALDCCAASFGSAEAEVLRWLVEIVEVVGGLPVALDTPHPEVLVHLAAHRRFPPLLNSVDASGRWPAPLLEATQQDRAQLVVQLRQGDGSIPHGLDDRRVWTDQALAALARRGIGPDRFWVDPVVLPWADDFAAGKPLLAYLQGAAASWPGLRTLVGLSNVSYGATGRRRLHRQWMARLRDAGLAGVLLDPLDAELLTIARSGGEQRRHRT